MINGFKKLFDSQVKFQKLVTGDDNLPRDNTYGFSYHVQAMVEEMGEVMKADKRWKTHRNTRYCPDEKLDELADVFITAMNLAIHSGFSYQKIEEAIYLKIQNNFGRLEEKNNDSNC